MGRVTLFNVTLFSLTLFSLTLTSPRAEAKTSLPSRYSYQQTFGSALRLVKVDLDFEVTETNSKWGYFLFTYANYESGKRKSRGSFQFVETDGAVQVALQIPTMPSYHEQIIIEKLKRKLFEEHGTPPPPKRDDRRKPRDGDGDGDGNEDGSGDGSETPKKDGPARDDAKRGAERPVKRRRR